MPVMTTGACWVCLRSRMPQRLANKLDIAYKVLSHVSSSYLSIVMAEVRAAMVQPSDIDKGGVPPVGLRPVPQMTVDPEACGAYGKRSAQVVFSESWGSAPAVLGFARRRRQAALAGICGTAPISPGSVMSCSRSRACQTLRCLPERGALGCSLVKQTAHSERR